MKAAFHALLILIILSLISGCTKRKIVYFHSDVPQKRYCMNAPIKTQSILPESIGDWTVHIELIKATKYIPAAYIPNSGDQYGMAIDFLYPSDNDKLMYKILFESVEKQQKFFHRASLLYPHDSIWYSDTSDCFKVDSVVLECLPIGDKLTAFPTSRFYLEHSEYSGFPPYPNSMRYPINAEGEKCGWSQTYIGTTESGPEDIGDIVFTERPSIQFEYIELPREADSVRVNFNVTVLDRSENVEITKHFSLVLNKYIGRLY